MTLNYCMMVERYPILEEEVGGSIPGCEISSQLDKELARWSTASYALVLACRHSISTKKKTPMIYPILTCLKTHMNRTHWNTIWLSAWSHMTSHYTQGSMTTLHDFGGVLGRPLDTSFGALTISWSWLLARMWSDPTVMDDELFEPKKQIVW